MATSGISTIGVTLKYGTGATADAVKSWTTLTRINSIGGISIEPEQIDASALEDKVSKYIQGRADTGGTWTVTVNVTNETISEWEKVITDASGGPVWFEIGNNDLTKTIHIYARVPAQLPVPEIGQNELETMEINLTVESYNYGTKSE